MLNNDLLMGIDVGTSSCKVAVFGLQGKLIKTAQSEYSIYFPYSGWMEQDPNEVFSKVIQCIKKVLDESIAPRVRALSVSSQGEAIIPVSKDGKPLSNSITTFDNRNIEECKWLSERINKKEILERTGLPLHPMFSLLKILWIVRNRPEIADKVWKYMCYGDFISYKLGAEAAIDYSMASRTMAFNIHTKRWDDRILGACEIHPDKLSEPVLSGTEIGKIHPEIARELSLLEETVIAAGGHDQACNALGVGVLEPGTAMNSIGTTESILYVDKKKYVSDYLSKSNIPCNCYVLEDVFSYMTFLTASASILDWFNKYFLGYRKIDDLLKSVDWEDTTDAGPILFPFFAGSGTPDLNPNSQGVIVGLDLSIQPDQIVRAILRGIAMEARLNLEIMQKGGIEIKKIIYVGGGTRSNNWLQMRVNINGIEGFKAQVDEPGCLGAAILAGRGGNIFKDTKQAAIQLSLQRKKYDVFPQSHSLYQKRYAEYARIRRKVTSIWDT